MSSMGKVAVPEKASFEVPPPPIPAKDIKETITTDVVVVGGGISGLTAVLSAAEAGAKTILLEKAPGVNFRGGWNAAFNSRLQKQAGINVDKDAVISTIMEWGSYKNDQRVVKLWADNCDQVMDWLLDMAEAANQPVVLDPVTRDWYFPHYPVTHFFVSRDKGDTTLQKNLAELLESNGKARGVDFRFETPAVRLLRKDKGRVSGVIAKNPKGDYIQFNARKAVVLCSGDYGGDKQMVEKYCSWQARELYEVSIAYRDATVIATGAADGRTNTGDGHKMGMWVGAAIDDPPHCVMSFDRTTAGISPQQITAKGQILKRYFLTIPRQPWLAVNINGERFVNEDIPWAYEANQYIQQPSQSAWKVWDSRYEQQWPKFKAVACKSIGAPIYWHKPEFMSKGIEWGAILTAPTIEGLAQKMEVPVETFKATVARYNELAQNGKDLDFGKHPDRLTTVEWPPFYACKVGGQYMVTLGGLKINTKLQVLDTERNPIPGLYAAGNVSGSFWGDEYPVTVPGASHSRAWTFGRLAGLAAAAEKV
jgi:fumarate reductase flavoprotein subunit